MNAEAGAWVHAGAEPAWERWPRRAARASDCARCGALILVGATSEPLSYGVRADPLPLDPVGEVLALMGTSVTPARATYDARWHCAGWYELDPREPWRIRAAPAGSMEREAGPRRPDGQGRPVVVVAAHACGAPALPMHQPTAAVLAAWAKRGRGGWVTEGPPPF